MKKILLISLLTCVGCFMTGCMTPYQPEGFQGGYSDMALSEDIYKISFDGNRYTSSEAINNYLLRRCAELTLKKGYKYFIILQSNMTNNGYTYHTPTVATTSVQGNTYSYGSYGYNAANATTIITPGSDETVDIYKGIAVIKLLQSNKNEPLALNASIIESNFSKK